MNKKFRTFIFVIAFSICLIIGTNENVLAYDDSGNYISNIISVREFDGILGDETEFSPIELSKMGNSDITIYAVKKEYVIPGGKGTLKSNAWRTYGDGEKIGNTRQWDYQVSAVYSGSQRVEYIKTTWQASASLRNSASITVSLGVGDSVSATAGGSSSWQPTKPIAKYFMNTKGQKESSYRSNMFVSPAKDYRSGTISIANTATVKLIGDAKPYQITAAY